MFPKRKYDFRLENTEAKLSSGNTISGGPTATNSTLLPQRKYDFRPEINCANDSPPEIRFPNGKY